LPEFKAQYNPASRYS